MPGTTAWQQQLQTVNTATQAVPAVTETVIATLVGVNSRSPGDPIFFDGSAFFAIQAATTATTLRIRQDSLTGSVVGIAHALASVAAQLSQATMAIAAVDQQAGEVAGKTYVLTIQATAAGAGWNVTTASLTALF